MITLTRVPPRDMSRQLYMAEQIIGKLREAEVLEEKGMPMEEDLNQLEVSRATYYKWRKECEDCVLIRQNG